RHVAFRQRQTGIKLSGRRACRRPAPMCDDGRMPTDQPASMNPLGTLRFDNRYRTLPASLYADVAPQPLAAPRQLVARSDDCLALLGLPPAEVSDTALLEAFSGERLLPGMAPLAQKYTGHQFGVYNPDLGDGRGLLLGEVILPDGSRRDLHLKGAGQTPFSRMGDRPPVL